MRRFPLYSWLHAWCQAFRMTALVVLFATASTSRLLAQDHTVASVFAALKPSLAIVLAGASAGTAFCVSSDASGSYFLTNAHVVKSATNVILYLQFPRFRKVTGVVVTRGVEESPDLALIRVNDAKVPSVRLWTGTPSEGEQIANAGYPSAQYTFAQISGQLTPSVHLGTISAIANRGGLIEFDAQTLPGNSGGPLFDPRTGDVVGVVTWKLKETTDANVAIGIGRTVIPFLTQNHIVYTPVKSPTTATSAAAPISQPSDAPAPEILRTLPGAGTVAILWERRA